MKYPIDLTTLSNEMLFFGYAQALESEVAPDLNTFVFEYRQEIDRRLESADMIALVELAEAAAKYLPAVFDSPIRKKITYSPTGQKAPGWLGLFSRKNRRIDSDSN